MSNEKYPWFIEQRIFVKKKIYSKYRILLKQSLSVQIRNILTKLEVKKRKRPWIEFSLGMQYSLNFLKIGMIFLASSGDEKVNIQNTLFASFPITANRVATWWACSSLSSFVAKV